MLSLGLDNSWISGDIILVLYFTKGMARAVGFSHCWGWNSRLPFHASYTEQNPLCWDSEGSLQPLPGVCLTDTGFLVSLQQEAAPEQTGLLLIRMCPTTSVPHGSQHFPQLGVEWAPAHCHLSLLPGDTGETQVWLACLR